MVAAVWRIDTERKTFKGINRSLQFSTHDECGLKEDDRHVYYFVYIVKVAPFFRFFFLAWIDSGIVGRIKIINKLWIFDL